MAIPDVAFSTVQFCSYTICHSTCAQYDRPSTLPVIIQITSSHPGHTWVDLVPASVAAVASMLADSSPAERTTGQVDVGCFEMCRLHFWLSVPLGADPMLKCAHQKICTPSL